MTYGNYTTVRLHTYLVVFCFVYYYLELQMLSGSNKSGFSFFFHRRGGEILGRVQVTCDMPFLMLREVHKMANQSAPEGWSKILVRLKCHCKEKIFDPNF